MTKIRYADEIGEYTIGENHNFAPHGQSQMGYGRKITTEHTLTFTHEKRYRRIYASCFSNVASHFIIYKGDNYYVRFFD